MHVRIVPSQGSGQLKSKRFENWRDMQKIANLMYESLESISSISVAEPGGGQHQSFGGTGRSGMSGLTRGMAVKPQIGETPAQTQITGFWDSTAKNDQPHPEHQRISGGEIFTGPATAIPWSQNPTTAVDGMVQDLKNAVEAAFGTDLPSGITFSIFRIDISGVIYGDRGYHFP
jgi:hypothetical protein